MMGIRCSQPQGLPPEAVEFLKNNAVKINQCTCCLRYDGYSREIIDTCGMCDDVDLYCYALVNGDTATEFVQEEIWSSGPMIWFGLRCKNSEFIWPSGAIVE